MQKNKVESSSEVKTEFFSLETVYGTLEIDDPLAIELILSAPFQRLKEINQYGVVNFIVPTENYTRFDHSLGVYFLLKSHRCSRQEQIAGLLHDASHTVFSHVGDYVFEERYPGSSYQDDIHLWYLEESGLAEILEKYDFSAESIYHKNPFFKALEQPLPYLCADRIEYNMQGGLLRHLITQKEFEQIQDCLHFDSERWVMHSLECAQKIGHCSLIMTETLWGAAWEALSYRLTAEALRKSFAIGLITFDEFHFSTDQLVWQKLCHSHDHYIQERIKKIQNIHSIHVLTEHGKEDLLLKLKFRGVDPLVLTPKGPKLLTRIDANYRAEFERVKHTMERGWAIRFLTY